MYSKTNAENHQCHHTQTRCQSVNSINEIDRINQNQTELQIEIKFKGDQEGFKSQLKNDFKGTGISDIKYQNICNEFIIYMFGYMMILIIVGITPI